eukprot:5280348-Pyramimonas_sp.AAC.1
MASAPAKVCQRHYAGRSGKAAERQAGMYTVHSSQPSKKTSSFRFTPLTHVAHTWQWGPVLGGRRQWSSGAVEQWISGS